MNLHVYYSRSEPTAMPTRSAASISSRRQPKQARSNDLVAAILEAALQVLAKEGARRFTTTRVAERAGVSVGSVYQYFPNKASILFRLQSDEWRQTTELLDRILQDPRDPPVAAQRAEGKGGRQATEKLPRHLPGASGTRSTGSDA